MILTFICLAGAVLALLSAALCTPRRWWQRPTVLGASLLLACSAAYAGGLWHWLAKTQPLSPILVAEKLTAPKPSAPREFFRVQQALHLRSSSATRAPLLARLPANQIVQTTGLREGDWWQVCSRSGLGWVSSLWLRRMDEPMHEVQQVPQCDANKP